MFDLLPGYIKTWYFIPAIFGTGLALALLLTPRLIRYAHKHGIVDRGGYRKKHQTAVPVIGGLAVLVPFVFICAALWLLGPLGVAQWRLAARIGVLGPVMEFARERFSLRPDLLILCAGAAAAAFLGILDDLRGLKARVKLLGQVVIALFICATGRYLKLIYIPFVGGFELNPIWGVVASSVWIVGLMNAFNLIDGIDGLAAGVGMITAAALAVLGGLNGNAFIVMICAALAGTLGGFLRFNFAPAKIFLGDTGSMLIGYLLAVITLLGTYKSETAFILVAPILALSLPLFEAVISMLRRFIRGVPIFAGDNYHTHHRLLYRGLSERKAVSILYTVTLFLSASAVLNNIIPEKTRWAWVPPALYFGTLIWLTWWAGYLRPQAIGRIFSRRARNSVLTTLAKYAAQTISTPHREVSLEEVFDICRREIKLDCLEAWFESSGTVICSCRAPGYSGDGTSIIKISPPTGRTVLVRYTFRKGLSEEERIDALACLGGIFEQTDTDALARRLELV